MKYTIILFFILMQISCKNTSNVASDKLSSSKLQKAFQTLEIKNTILIQNNKYACEPSIAINPKNPNNIIAGSVMNNVHYTNDNTQNWQTDLIQSKYGVYGDPCLFFNQKGMAFYMHLANSNKSKVPNSTWLDRIVIQKSLDQGKTWTDGTGIGLNGAKVQDKAWFAINPKTDALAVTWTEFDSYKSTKATDKSRIRFSQSLDDGETWSKAITISQLEGDCLDDDNTTEGAVPTIDNAGNIYVAWAFNNKIYFDYSTDNGKTWQDEDKIIANQVEGWNLTIPDFGRANGLPITMVDNSNSDYAGTIYVNWADQRNGKDNTDVFLIKSTDKGKTWTKPLRVNTDNTISQQWFTWMSVDPKTGYIYIVYYDRSAYKDAKTDVTLAISADGGAHFTSRVISKKPFKVDTTKIYFMGDYNNVAAYDSKVALIWTRADQDKTSVVTSVLDLKEKQ